MGGGDEGLPLLSIPQSAEPTFFRASALIRLSSGSRIGLITLQSGWEGAGPPSTQEVPPSGIRVTLTSAKSCNPHKFYINIKATGDASCP